MDILNTYREEELGMIRDAINSDFEKTYEKIRKYRLIDKIGNPGDELTFINKSMVNDMNAEINHIDIGYLRLLYKRIKILENGWILCGTTEREYTDIFDKNMNLLYKVAMTMGVQSTGLTYVERTLENNIKDNESLREFVDKCDDDLENNEVQTVIVSEYNARDTLLGMTEIIRVTRRKCEDHGQRGKYKLRTIGLFDDYGQEITGLDFDNCVVYSVIPVERTIGIDNIYNVQTYSFETDKVISYAGIEQYGIIRILGKFRLGGAARSIGKTSVLYVIDNNKKLDKNELSETESGEKESKHLSTATVLKFRFDSLENKIDKVEFRRVQFDGIEKVVTVG